MSDRGVRRAILCRADPTADVCCASEPPVLSSARDAVAAGSLWSSSSQKRESGARTKRAQKVGSWGWCLERAPRDLFCRPAETQGRFYRAARGHAFEQTGSCCFDHLKQL